MRLEFNIVFIDDEYNDADKNRGLLDLVSAIKKAIENKGFDPVINFYEDPKKIDEQLSRDGRRIDLYISDNNLGAGLSEDNIHTNDNGIEFYLQLQEKLSNNESLCDFILYTKSSIDGIIENLTENLKTRKNPNLFSRFTFVSRDDITKNWHKPILKVINLMLTKREEINNLRGLYAQKTAEMHNYLKKLMGRGAEKLDFYNTIEQAWQNKVIDQKLKDDLHFQRDFRNGLLHNDEEYCSQNLCYFINFITKVDNVQHTVYEKDFSTYRTQLNDICQKIKQLK